MATRENDRTQNMARPAVIIAGVRSGGTFLAHCLSNHPQIFCARGEPLHHGSEWCRSLQPDRRRLLAALLNQTGYHVSMCKLTYTQAFQRDIWAWLIKRQPLVIWLRRHNVIRQAVSVLINKRARDGQLERAQHSFEHGQWGAVELPPNEILKVARGLTKADERASGLIKGMERFFWAIYEEMVDTITGSAESIDPIAGAALCEFLGVSNQELSCSLKRINPWPLEEMLSNWAAVKKAISKSEFAGMLFHA